MHSSFFSNPPNVFLDLGSDLVASLSDAHRRKRAQHMYRLFDSLLTFCVGLLEP
jgi:hypothetical protein